MNILRALELESVFNSAVPKGGFCQNGIDVIASDLLWIGMDDQRTFTAGKRVGTFEFVFGRGEFSFTADIYDKGDEKNWGKPPRETALLGGNS